MVFRPHYVRDYQQLVRNLLESSANEEEAMERAVGGSYERVGNEQAEIVREFAPDGPFFLVDIGCGSGRAAYALRGEERISYLGVDVIPDLLEHAKKKVERPDWRFEQISSIVIPAEDNVADIILIMSVFTHLTPGEIKSYLRECMRVLKPGGAVIASYLERDNAKHRSLYYRPWQNLLARLRRRDVMTSFTSQNELSERFERAGFVVERAITDNPIGQHILVGRKP